MNDIMYFNDRMNENVDWLIVKLENKKSRAKFKKSKTRLLKFYDTKNNHQTTENRTQRPWYFLNHHKRE